MSKYNIKNSKIVSVGDYNKFEKIIFNSDSGSKKQDKKLLSELKQIKKILKADPDENKKVLKTLEKTEKALEDNSPERESFLKKFLSKKKIVKLVTKGGLAALGGLAKGFFGG